MITVADIVDKLALQVRAGAGTLRDRQVTGGYASDLLSCVMAGARKGDVWVTLQAHPNVIAVAVLLELAAVIITEGAQPDPETLKKAEAEDVPVLTTTDNTFVVVTKLAALGVQGACN